MSHQPLLPDALTRHSNQMKHGQAVRLASHDSVESRKLTHPIGGGQQGRSPDSRITISGVGGIQLIGRTHPIQAGNLLYRIIDREGVVTGDAEDLVDTQLGKTGQCVLRDAKVVHWHP